MTSHVYNDLEFYSLSFSGHNVTNTVADSSTPSTTVLVTSILGSLVFLITVSAIGFVIYKRRKISKHGNPRYVLFKFVYNTKRYDPWAWS